MKKLFTYITLTDIKHFLLELHGPLIIDPILTDVDFIKFLFELQDNHTLETIYTNVYIKTYMKEQQEYKQFLQKMINDHPTLQILSMLKSGSSKNPTNVKYEIKKTIL